MCLSRCPSIFQIWHTITVFPLLWWHKIPCIQVKAMKSKVNLASNHNVCVDNVNKTKDVNQNYFCKWHLEKWNLKYRICKFHVFQGFELKFQVFTTFWANSRHFPGMEKKMTKFQVFQVGCEPWIILLPVHYKCSSPWEIMILPVHYKKCSTPWGIMLLPVHYENCP